MCIVENFICVSTFRFEVEERASVVTNAHFVEELSN